MPKTLAPSNVVTNRDPKGSKFMAIVAAAYDKTGMSEEEAQRVNDTPGLADLVSQFIAENRLTDKYKNEEVLSTYGYLSGYTTPKSIADQVNILRDLFPQLVSTDVDESFAAGELPAGAEGTFAIPRWQKIAPTYGEAVQKVLDTIKQTRDGKLTNYIEGKLGPQYLRQHAKTVEAFQKLEEAQQGHDILVVPCQFGIRHRGRSVRRACEVMSPQEFGLGAFAIGIMILTHPERLQNYDDLWIDCAGDERSPDADGSFGRAPVFRFDDGEVRFLGGCVGYANGGYGSVSGLLSQ